MGEDYGKEVEISFYMHDVASHCGKIYFNFVSKDEKNEDVIQPLMSGPTLPCPLQLWDLETKKRVRKMAGHEGRVNSVTWNEEMLTR